MKKCLYIAAITLGIIGALAITVGVQYKRTYPYGWSHCCIIAMSFSLDQYAEEHAGHYPTGEASPEASLSLLYRSNYVDANTMRGMTMSEKTVRRILEGGGLLGPDTCGWHYTEGLTLADDPQIALLYCKQPLGHNGEKTEDGGREVAFVGGYIGRISGEKWQSFLQQQGELLAKRSDRAKAGKPLVDAIIELPDGRQIESIDASYTMHEQDVGTDGSISSNGSSSGTLLNRYAIVWFNPPYSADYSGRITRTLSFSNLISAPVTVTFTNGVPDKTDEVFQMHLR
jgi:hypothetical protein